MIGDGVTSAPDLKGYDNMTMLLNREDITCTSILIGSGPHLHCAFGYTPDTEILRHLATSTSGAYIERSFLPVGHALQELLLLKTFSPTSADAPAHPYVSTLAMDGEAVVSDMSALHAMMAVDYPFPWVGPPPMVPLLQTQYKTYALECDLPRIMDVRVREGFVVTAITIDDPVGKEKSLSTRVILSWLPNIKIAYNIQVSIGAKGPGAVLKIEIIVLAYYEFLHQFMKNEKGAQSSEPAGSVGKLQSFLTNIHETDLVLSYLYCQSQNQASPSLTPVMPATPQNLQMQTKAFWKTMNGLRNHSWNRWLKTEKIGLVLSPLISVLDQEHVAQSQFPLPRPRAVYPSHFLYDPPTAILMDYFTSWATFHQSRQLFVKFFDPPPGVNSSNLPSSSFCVIRLCFETSGFLIVHLAFFLTSPATRSDTILSLKRELAALTYPDSSKERANIGANPMPTLRAISVGPPVTPISRSIRTMLVRYDIVSAHSNHGSAQQPANPARLVYHGTAIPLPSYSPLLAWYMWRHRWVWTLPELGIAEQMLGILIECRLREGFTLVNVSHGIYTFVKEFTLYTPNNAQYPRVALPCALQYVVFVSTPHMLTTEMWMEPQQGRHRHTHGESTEAELFSDLRTWFEGIDTKVVSAISTLFLLDSADIRDKKLDLSSYPRPPNPPAAHPPTVHSLVHPSTVAYPSRRLDILSEFSVEKIERSYPLLCTSEPTDGQVIESFHPYLNNISSPCSFVISSFLYHLSSPSSQNKAYTSTNVTTDSTTTKMNGHAVGNHKSGATALDNIPDGPPSQANSPSAIGEKDSQNAALLETVNTRLLSMVADCIVWLSDYEVFPDKLSDDAFKRGRCFVKIIRTHPRSPPRSTYSNTLLSTRLVLVHLQSSRTANNASKSVDVAFYIMSAEALRCPPPPSSQGAERVSALFKQKDVKVISQIEEKGKEEEAEKVEEDDENRVAQNIVAEYLAQIQQAYSRCFTKAVYTSLRSQGRVSSQDFSACLGALHTSHLDIDLSEFLEVIALSPQPSSAGDLLDFDDEFIAEHSLSFTRVPLSGIPYFFYHRMSPEKAKQISGYNVYEVEDEDETYGYDKGADMEYDHPQPDVHSSSSLELCPPFIGEMEGDVETKDTLGVYSLPLFLRMEIIRECESPEVVASIPTSNIGTVGATLRFVCLVLPPLLGPAKLVHESICTALHKHKKRIVALLSAKILSSYLSVIPLSDSTLTTVVHHLTSLAPSHAAQQSRSTSRYVQCTTFELHFVDRREGNMLFPQELKNSKPTPSTSEVNPTMSCLSGDLYTLATRPTSSDSMSDEPVTYWLHLVCKTDAVVATLFSPLCLRNMRMQANPVNKEDPPLNDDENDTWKAIRAGIAAVSRRVNQMILLYHLHENRMCAELLLPSDSPAQANALRASTSKDDKGDAKGRVTNFHPGEFECPLVHTISLPLHERVTPKDALGYLMLNVLHPFEVANHSSLFVYHQKNGRIFYICPVITTTIRSSSPAPQVIVETHQQTSPPPSPSLPTQGLGQVYITLNIYGIDPAGPEITQHLHQHLENKLSTYILTNFSTLFKRNPLLKLTPEDLDFLRPPTSAQTPAGPRNPVTIALQIPSFVEEPYILLLFLRQNLLQFLQTIHLSQAAQQREDAEIATESNVSHEHLDIRPSEFMLMYHHHISSPTSALPFTTIGQGMACISLSLLDNNDSCMAATPRPYVRNQNEWTQEDLQVTLLADAPQAISNSTNLIWSHRVLLKIWCRGSVNTQALANHLALCANQTLCEYVLESTLLPPSYTVSLDSLPKFMHSLGLTLSRARALAIPSVYEFSATIPLSSWACHSFISDLRDIIADSNYAHGLQVYACGREADDTLRCMPYPSGPRVSAESSSTKAGCGDCDHDSSCTTAADFYNYGEDAPFEDNEGELDLASAMMHQSTHGLSYFILGGKKVDSSLDQHPTALFYPPIKDSQFAEPIIRHYVISVQLDKPRAHEYGYNMTIYAYNWDQSRLDNFKERCSRLVSLYSLKQHFVSTISHHKMGLYQHYGGNAATPSNGQAQSKLSWENVDTISAPPHARRRTTSYSSNQDTEKHKEDKEDRETDRPQEHDYKKLRLETHRPPRPSVEFDSVFRDHYPHFPLDSTSLTPSAKDPVLRLAHQARALATHIEHRAAMRTAAIGSISILPNPSSSTPSAPLTSFQLDSIVTVARLVHFRCVPFLFDEQFSEFEDAPSKSSLSVLDAFVRDYIAYLTSFGVKPVLTERNHVITPSKRVSTRAYLQKVFLDGTLLVKISFREASVACELFTIPQLNHPAQTLQFPPHPARIFGEELNRFTRALHLNSFTYDFHVTQLYRMIKYPHSPTTQSISSILQALHQYYPTPPVHASTSLDSLVSFCPVLHLSPEIAEITTNHILEFMMQENPHTTNSATPLRHIGINPALLLHIPPTSPYSNMCAVFFAKEALVDTDPECGCEERPISPQADLPIDSTHPPNTVLLSVRVFVVKVGEVCSTEPAQRSYTPSADNSLVIEKLHKAIATSGINYQRNELWHKLQRGNPYSPALTHSEFEILAQLVLSRPATLLDSTLIQPVNLLKLGSGVWHQLLAQLRTVSGERVRQVFADPVHHLLIFHPTNNTQLVHFLWNEAEKEASILLCRLDKDSVGIETCDADERDHLSQLVTMVCHFTWKLFLVKQPF